jgi:phage shock protein A
MFGRIANLFKGFLSLFVSGVERRNPEALLELEQENLRKQVGNFNQGLASHAGLSERLMSQVRKLEAEQKDLRAKTTAPRTRRQQFAAGPIRAAASVGRSPARRKPHAARAGRNHLQESW